MLFEEEISLTKHYLACYQVENAIEQYHHCVDLAYSNNESQLELKGLMVDIVSSLLGFHIDYEIYDDGVYFDLIGVEKLLKRFLDNTKYPWIKRNGLDTFINFIITYDENVSQWDKKLFFKSYYVESKITFGENKGSRISDLIQSYPQEVISLQSDYYHFIIDLDVFFDRNFHNYLNGENPKLYWRTLARSIIKMIIKERIEEIKNDLEPESDDKYENSPRDDSFATASYYWAYELDPPEDDY